MGAGKELRPYQELAITSIISDLEAGTDKILLSMSMGLGKTFTAVKLEERLKSKKTIWVTDDEKLLEQSALAFINDKFDKSFHDYVENMGFINYCRQGGIFAATGYKMSVIKQDLCDTSGDVVFASAQTLWRRVHLLDKDLFDVMIIDEAHCFGAKRLFEGISHFNVRLRLGLSGTPFRQNGMLMGDMFDRISFEYGMKEGITNRFLCEIDAIRIKTNTNINDVGVSGGEFKINELSNTVNNPARNYLIAESYLKYCKGRQAIGYGVDIQHCMDLADCFRDKGINAVAVSSDDERTGDKNIYIKAYKQKQIDVIFSVNLLSKGFDHPDTGCTIAAAPTKSLVRYLQGPAGRGSRLKSPEFVAKFGQNCIILDVVDNTSRHNLVNAWELDKDKDPEDRVFITQEKRDKLLEARKKKVLLNIKREEDERVSLLKIPKPKISKSIRMQEPASEKQLAWIASLGYDVVNDSYTKQMCSQIIMDLPATEKQRGLLKFKGYDVDSVTVLTRGMMEAAMKDLEKREAAKLAKK